ncbi:response regulator receiver modulated diguanylate cyclase [Pseudomonas psychrotolerans L19]|uniref:diguanylate cyclase domain-containing protein n=1 Tax=Pseudomonas oryzihabitans TaxID=47885 RepID=UPI00023A341F|nr:MULTISPECIES: diguanylate cyclase [Pseudomonas]EHK73143.1 response regulator receiver modulated diguanylate cyclase [Pseudomonas psychrotolerans L19]MBA1180635.1 diguanylate cyclase [Pseudomonas psychrotolerans]MBA1211637.1 diguanylate cyclase [Pseudomonas psychrotolerans]
MEGRRPDLPLILIVDDQKSNLRVLGDLLRNEARIMLAKSGVQALTKAAREHPDLILLDVVMPGIDGLQLIQLFKRRAETSAIPVIFITAANDLHREVECFELGASDFIQKPFNPLAVLARVRLHLQLARQRRLLEELAHMDPLTAVGNRRRFDEQLTIEWQLAVNRRGSLAIAMLDIDYFKQYNDTHGHGAGDQALARVAQVLEQRIRERDCLARYGGEEFVLLLPGASRTAAEAVLERCRQGIAELRIAHPLAEDRLWLTMSMGLACCNPTPEQTPEGLLKAADNLLYQAKAEGRNRLVSRSF